VAGVPPPIRTESLSPGIGERLARVETLVEGLAEDLTEALDFIRLPNAEHDKIVILVQDVEDLKNVNITRRSNSRQRVSTLFVVLALAFTVPSTVTAFIGVYHLAEPTHTIIQNPNPRK
jgi:hypothetical protein